MSSPVPLIQAIQSNEDVLRQTLGSEANPFFSKFDALVVQYRTHPASEDEVYKQLQALVASSSAATQVLQDVAPRLLNAPNSESKLGNEPISTLASDNNITSGKLSGDNSALAKSEDSQSQTRRVIEPVKPDVVLLSTTPQDNHSRNAPQAVAAQSTDHTHATPTAQGGSTDMAKGKDTGPKQWTPELIIQFFKEVVTALMGLSLIAYTLYMLNSVLGLVGDANKLTSAKDLLLLLLSLTGVVLGYYFGRLPADARAAQAQQQAVSATSKTAQIGVHANQLNQQLDNLDKAVTRGKDAVTRSGASIGAGGQDLTTAQNEIQRLREGLRQLSDMARLP